MANGTTLQEITKNLLRIMAGFLFAPHGAQKLFGVLDKAAVDSIVSLSGLAGILEFFGGIALILGIFTRQVAFVLSGQMAVAYWMAHGAEAFWPILNRGELAALYSFVFLFLFAHGGGNFSIDGWLRRRR
jgi:putative oxidoreductase